MKKEDAEEFTHSLGQIVAGSWRQIALAKRLGVPKALGLSVEDWVKNCLGGYVRLSVAERREAVKELSAKKDNSTREIGEILGVDHATVINDKRAGENSPADNDKVNDSKNSSGVAGENSPVDAVAAIAVTEEQFKKSKRAKKDKERKEPIVINIAPGVRRGDFREVLSDIEDGSSRLVLTDPPYPKADLPLWEDLAKFSARVLRDDGLLITYSGQMFVPEIMKMMSKHLDWWWMGAVVHSGNGNLTPLGHPARKVINQWKPLLMFAKKGCGYDKTFRDVVPSGGSAKDSHNWQQPVSEAMWLVLNFSDQNDLVVDPFAGSGTVARACEETKRVFVGAEKEYGQEQTEPQRQQVAG